MKFSLSSIQWSDAVQTAAQWLNPVTGSPAAPLESAAAVEAFGPSLMPRASTHQGLMTGLSILTARGITAGTEKLTNTIVAPDAPLSHRLVVRAGIAGVGVAANAIPEAEDENLWRAGLRSTGWALWNGALGGAVYDTATHLSERFPSQRGLRPLLVGGAATAGLVIWAGQRLTRRKEEIERWPVPQKNTLPAALTTSLVTAGIGSGLARSYRFTRDSLIHYLGPGWSKQVLGRTANAAAWTWGATTLYNAGVGYIGRANEKVEAGYSTPPTSPLVSGAPESGSPFEDLGQQGRRFVTDVVTSDLIEEVMAEPAVAHPIRTFVGYNSEPMYNTGRAEMALAELARTGAFDREYLLLVSPTGTGWVDQTMIESAEFLSRGNIATCCIQYGRFPSFLSLQKVQLGRRQFRLLLWAVKQRLDERPPEKRPKVIVFGESLGAWTASDTVMYQGIGGFDHYGIHRALWVGLPGLAKWSRNGMSRGSTDLVPAGTVGVFDSHRQLAALSDEERKSLRAIILSHDNDPIAQVAPEVLVQRPTWLGDERGRGVPQDMSWAPVTTFLQTAIDAANAMVTVPGEFLSFGHDYRADMAAFVHATFDEPATDEQMERIEKALRLLELERSDRIKAQSQASAPPAPAQRENGERIEAGVPLRVTRTSGANWFGKRGDVQ